MLSTRPDPPADTLWPTAISVLIWPADYVRNAIRCARNVVAACIWSAERSASFAIISPLFSGHCGTLLKHRLEILASIAFGDFRYLFWRARGNDLAATVPTFGTVKVRRTSAWPNDFS